MIISDEEPQILEPQTYVITLKALQIFALLSNLS